MALPDLCSNCTAFPPVRLEFFEGFPPASSPPKSTGVGMARGRSGPIIEGGVVDGGRSPSPATTGRHSDDFSTGGVCPPKTFVEASTIARMRARHPVGTVCTEWTPGRADRRDVSHTRSHRSSNRPSVAVSNALSRATGLSFFNRIPTGPDRSKRLCLRLSSVGISPLSWLL